MMYFGNRRPRGFRHHYIYVDERRELLRQLAEGRRPSADGSATNADGSASEGDGLSATTGGGSSVASGGSSAYGAGRRGEMRRTRQSGGGCLVAGMPALAALLVLLAAVALFLFL